MKFNELSLKGAFLIETERRNDERGYFARTFCTKEFSAHGLIKEFVQCSTSMNLKKGLIRGMHFQIHPYQETKIVRCTRGGIYDVIIDLREDSPTYKKSYGVELTAENGRILYVPKGFAHGYQVLRDNTEVLYMMDEFYVPEAAREISPFSMEIELPQWPLEVFKG